MRKPRVFTVMPIRPETEDLWELGIKETCERLGMDCQRADKLMEPGFIVTQIYNQIADADLVIGDVTDQNPNVFYEIGYAHALGKPTFLLARSKDALKVFDTSGLRHQWHDGRVTKVREILAAALPEFLIGGEVLYRWPAAGVDAPAFDWEAREPHRKNQRDLQGGQKLRPTSIGEIIQITNTDELWNHKPKQSIMRLGPKRWTELQQGDQVSVIVELRSEGSGTITLCGDGGHINPEQKTGWVRCWEDKKMPIGRTAWTTLAINTQVVPTQAGYDPAVRGATIYLITAIGSATLEIKGIRFVRIREQRASVAKA